jgi:hypothetical protein
MSRFNPSHWGIRHPQLLAFLILVIGLSGAFAYSRLGRAEDPAFTIKTAVVSVEWPGATAAEMQGQVADRIEKKLQELPWVDKIDSYYKPGFASISLNFRDSTPPRDVPMLFLELRKKMSDLLPDLPAGVLGPFGSLHDRRRRRLVRSAEGGRRGVPKAPAARRRRHQGRSLRRPAGAHLRRVQPREAGDARRSASGRIRFDREAECA